MKRVSTCPVCGGTDFTVHIEQRQIRADDAALLPYEAQYSKCRNCGEEFFTRVQSRAASRAAAGALRAYAGLLTPAQIIGIREQYGVTQVELEKVLNLGKKSVVRWEAGTVCQSRTANRLLREVRDSPELFRRLAREAGVELHEQVASVDSWELLEPQSSFEGTAVAQPTVGPGERRRQPRRAAIPEEFDVCTVTVSPGFSGMLGASFDHFGGSASPELIVRV